MSEVKQVSAKSPKLNRETVITVAVGKTVEESIEMFGGDAINSNAIANWVVTLQAAIRRLHSTGKGDEEVQELLESAKMGVATSGGAIDPIQASLAKFKTMNAEEQAAYVEQLRTLAEAA